MVGRRLDLHSLVYAVNSPELYFRVQLRIGHQDNATNIQLKKPMKITFQIINKKIKSFTDPSPHGEPSAAGR